MNNPINRGSKWLLATDREHGIAASLFLAEQIEGLAGSLGILPLQWKLDSLG
jgi:hypothetical protein